MATVDIVIPCYNYGRFLEGCVNSVLSQSISDIRVLIIDDASSDGSQAIGEALAASDARVSFISHPKNRGHIKTYNEGIDWLELDYFLLLPPTICWFPMRWNEPASLWMRIPTSY